MLRSYHPTDFEAVGPSQMPTVIPSPDACLQGRIVVLGQRRRGIGVSGVDPEVLFGDTTSLREAALTLYPRRKLCLWYEKCTG